MNNTMSEIASEIRAFRKITEDLRKIKNDFDAMTKTLRALR